MTKTLDNGTEQSFAIPGGSGEVIHVRVLDTDRTAGSCTRDTLSINRMYFLSQPAP